MYGESVTSEADDLNFSNITFSFHCVVFPACTFFLVVHFSRIEFGSLPPNRSDRVPVAMDVLSVDI